MTLMVLVLVLVLPAQDEAQAEIIANYGARHELDANVVTVARHHVEPQTDRRTLVVVVNVDVEEVGEEGHLREAGHGARIEHDGRVHGG